MRNGRPRNDDAPRLPDTLPLYRRPMICVSKEDMSPQQPQPKDSLVYSTPLTPTTPTSATLKILPAPDTLSRQRVSSRTSAFAESVVETLARAAGAGRWRRRHRGNGTSYDDGADTSSSSVTHSSYRRMLAERTTFHGVRDCYLTEFRGLRFAWMVIIVIAVVASLQGCYLIVREFLARPVIVSYLIEEADLKGMLLPDIVICPFNRFNRTYLKSLNVSDGVAQYLELAYPSPVLHSFQARTYRNTIRRLDEYDAELSALLERIGNMSFNTFMKQSAIDCTAFFENSAVCENLTEIMTSAGKCFRIPGSIQEGDGFGYGARFVIKLPQHLYNPGVNQMLNDGIAVKLAERNRGIDHDLSFIPSGVHAIMPLTATRYEFINDPPRYKCELNVDNTYSRVWCFEMAELKCNCSLAASQAAVASQPRTPKICTTLQFFRCYAPEIFHANVTYDIERCKARCTAPCTYWAYVKSVSYAHFPSEQAKFFVKDEEEWASLKNTIILEVFYTNLDYTIIRHIHAMTPSGFLAQIGGQISLWIGGSIISLIQLLIYLCYGGYSLWRRRVHAKRRRQHRANVADAHAPPPRSSGSRQYYHEVVVGPNSTLTDSSYCGSSAVERQLAPTARLDLEVSTNEEDQGEEIVSPEPRNYVTRKISVQLSQPRSEVINGTLALQLDVNGTASAYPTRTSFDVLVFEKQDTPRPDPDDQLLAQVFSSVHLMDVKYIHPDMSPLPAAAGQVDDESALLLLTMTPDDDNDDSEDDDGKRRELEALEALDTALKGAASDSEDSATTTDVSSTTSLDGDAHAPIVGSIFVDRRVICERKKSAYIEDDEPFIIIGNKLTEESGNSKEIEQPHSPAPIEIQLKFKPTVEAAKNSADKSNKLNAKLKSSSALSERTAEKSITDFYMDVSDVLRRQLLNAKSVGDENGIKYFNPPFHWNDADENIERFIVGGEMPESEDDKVLILFGSRGAGKTSLVTTILNHLYDVKKEHEFRLCINDPREIQATNTLTEYTFNNTVYTFRVTVIDTPGVPPSIANDENSLATSEMIHRWFHNKLKADGKIRLDAVVLVANGREDAINESTIKQLNLIKKIFISDMKLNLLPVVTFSEALAQLPVVISSLITAKTHFPRYFTVQNDSVLPLNAGGNALRHSLNFKHTDVSLESLFLYLHNTVQPLLAVAKKRDYYSNTQLL